MADGYDYAPKTHYAEFSIGAIMDYNSPVAKEEKLAMEMAIEDFYNCTSHRPVLHVRDSRRNPVRAAYAGSKKMLKLLKMMVLNFAARNLIKEQRVQAVVGLRTWEEAEFVAELGDKFRIPILSLAESAPSWASQRWPFLVQATHSQYAQMRAISAIVGNWQWRKVVVIYEDINSAASHDIIPHLVDALREVGSTIDRLIPLSPLASPSLSKELGKLKSGQGTRIFIVHTSLPLATHLFMEAKRMGMMENGYVWITTGSITGLLDYVNASVISSMQGVLGVKSYFPKTSRRFKHFQSRFRKRFRLEHPEEANLEPTNFGLQAYDAVWAVVLAAWGRTRKNIGNSTDQMDVMVQFRAKKLLRRILGMKFKALTGEFRFADGKLAPAHIFEIVNVVGKSYRELGFWVDGLGFSKNINKGEAYNTSMGILGQVFWPGGPWSVPRGWDLPTIENRPLKIGVPAKTTFNQFVKVKYERSGGEPSITGFSIDVFKATVDRLPYHLSYQFVPYEGTYDALVQQISLKTIDSVVGDTSIVANRCQYAEFSQPYSQSGLQMVVLEESKRLNKAWLFMKPFTNAMWGYTLGINTYNGFVVWLIERKHNTDFKGPWWNQVGTLLWLAFTTLCSLHGDRMHSNLSRMAMVVWLFVALVTISCYTASLSSMLTLQGLKPAVVDIDSLKNSNAKVGCSGRSFVAKYLEEVLDFNPKNIMKFSSGDDYGRALKSGVISAAFLEVPYVKLFLAKNCHGFTVSGSTYKVGGFGFVFPRGSPMVADFSEAILKLSEQGKLLELENAMVSSYNCSSSESDGGPSVIGPGSFVGLFFITGGTSTLALMIFLFRFLSRKWPFWRSARAASPGQSPKGDMHV
ncbi:hypothetical protein HHK36_005069 [Tetracentron sinense]|uniref:Glutamate receptor n=1 Tax=Tetracentron sinense TaxID=13715 RepID=A0A834ZPQ4_TETSI|nr:hypothetical protein HHK36_005069 [Tetracentron sinense]